MIFNHKLLKFIVLSLVGLFVIVSVAIVILISFVDPNKYKPLIIASVNEVTGRNLHLDGDITWKLWPNIGLKAQQMSLSNPVDFETGNFVEMKSVSVSVNILPLLRNRIVINDLNIKGLNLNLLEKDHKNNWTFKPNVNAKIISKENAAVKFELHSFSLTDAILNYHNSDSKTEKTWKNFTFTLDTPADGGIRFNSQNQQVNLDNVNFNLNNQLKGTALLSLRSQEKLLYNGNVTLSPFSANQLADKLGVKPLPIRNKAMLDNVSFSTAFEGSDSSATFSNLVLHVGDSVFKGLVHITNFSPLNIQNDVNVDQTELSDWIDTSGYKLPLQNINIHGTLNNAIGGITSMVAQQNLSIQNVALYGINIQDKVNYAEKTLSVNQFANPVKLVERLNTMLSTTTYNKKDLKQKTDLGKLTTGVILRGGVLTTPGFLLTGPTLRTTNSGYINFPKNYINYHTYTKIVSIPERSLLGSITYPYIIQGNLKDPTMDVDKVSIQKQVFDYYGSATGRATEGVTKSVKDGTQHLWNKIFH